MTKLKFTNDDMTMKQDHKVKGYLNLNTILMVENFLKKHRDIPMKISEIKKNLPKRIIHQNLLQILNYLQMSGKILIGTKGVLWIFAERKRLNRLIKDSLEV